MNASKVTSRDGTESEALAKQIGRQQARGDAPAGSNPAVFMLTPSQTFGRISKGAHPDFGHSLGSLW